MCADVQSNEYIYYIAEGQKASYVIVCPCSVHMTFVLERYADVRIECIVVSDADITIRCILRGQESNAIIRGACIVGDGHKVRITTMQHHEASHTTSSCVIKNIISDAAFVSYSGMIRVDREARFSVSSQENKNIVESDSARVISVPSLEVLPHDVHCFHGSATGRYEKDVLLYAAARGIDEKQMQQLLKKAFFDDMFISEQAIAFLSEIFK